MKTVKTNELKKGTLVLLRNGWEAELVDNLKGNTRLAKVYGYETEIGSVYSHDIIWQLDAIGGNAIAKIEHTPAQLKCREFATSMGM